MKFRPITVTAGDGTGEKRQADLMLCDVCPDDPAMPSSFVVFQFESGHPHLQCAICGTTYCCGDCEKGWVA